MDRFKLLVFSYYREEPQIQKILGPLNSCRIFRSGDSIQIQCLDLQHHREMRQLMVFLGPPFARLGLAKELVLTDPAFIRNTYTMQLRSNSDLFS